jgi:hypothetical protein
VLAPAVGSAPVSSKAAVLGAAGPPAAVQRRRVGSLRVVHEPSPTLAT